MEKNYPTGQSSAVKKEIGGKVDANWIDDTCCIKMSRALNYSGVGIPTIEPDLTISGADGK